MLSQQGASLATKRINDIGGGWLQRAYNRQIDRSQMLGSVRNQSSNHHNDSGSLAFDTLPYLQSPHWT